MRSIPPLPKEVEVSLLNLNECIYKTLYKIFSRNICWHKSASSITFFTDFFTLSLLWSTIFLLICSKILVTSVVRCLEQEH